MKNKVVSDGLHRRLAYLRGNRRLHNLLDSIPGLSWEGFEPSQDIISPSRLLRKFAPIDAEPNGKLLCDQFALDSDENTKKIKFWLDQMLRDADIGLSAYLMIGGIEGNLPWSIVHFDETKEWLICLFKASEGDFILLSKHQSSVLYISQEEHFILAFIRNPLNLSEF